MAQPQPNPQQSQQTMIPSVQALFENLGQQHSTPLNMHPPPGMPPNGMGFPPGAIPQPRYPSMPGYALNPQQYQFAYQQRPGSPSVGFPPGMVPMAMNPQGIPSPIPQPVPNPQMAHFFGNQMQPPNASADQPGQAGSTSSPASTPTKQFQRSLSRGESTPKPPASENTPAERPGKRLEGEKVSVVPLEAAMRAKRQPSATAITLMQQDINKYTFRNAATIAVNNTYLCYVVAPKNNLVRTLNWDTAEKGIIRDHAGEGVTIRELKFASETSSVLASIDSKGAVCITEFISTSETDPKKPYTPKLVAKIEPTEADVDSLCVVWSTVNPEIFATADSTNRIFIYDVQTLRAAGESEPTKTFKRPAAGNTTSDIKTKIIPVPAGTDVNDLSFSPNGEHVIAALSNGSVVFWDASLENDNTAPLSTLVPHGEDVEVFSARAIPVAGKPYLLLTGGYHNEEIAIWTKTDESSAEWTLSQTVKLPTGGDRQKHGYHVQLDNTNSFLFVINTSHPSIYCFHLNHATAQFNNVTEFFLAQKLKDSTPVLSFVVTNHVVGTEPEMQLYCIQTTQLQRFDIRTATAYVPPEEQENDQSQPATVVAPTPIVLPPPGMSFPPGMSPIPANAAPPESEAAPLPSVPEEEPAAETPTAIPEQPKKSSSPAPTPAIPASEPRPAQPARKSPSPPVAAIAPSQPPQPTPAPVAPANQALLEQTDAAFNSAVSAAPESKESVSFNDIMSAVTEPSVAATTDDKKAQRATTPNKREKPNKKPKSANSVTQEQGAQPPTISDAPAATPEKTDDKKRRKKSLTNANNNTSNVLIQQQSSTNGAPAAAAPVVPPVVASPPPMPEIAQVKLPELPPLEPGSRDDAILVRMELMMKMQNEYFLARLQEQRELSQAAEKERQKQTLALISESLNNNLEKIVQKHLRANMSAVTKVIVSSMENTLINSLQDSLKKLFFQSFQPAIEIAVKETISKNFSSKIVGQAVSEQVVGSITEPANAAFRQYFGDLLVPGIERAIQNMMGQIVQTMEKGLAEFQLQAPAAMARGSHPSDASTMTNVVGTLVELSEKMNQSIVDTQSKILQSYMDLTNAQRHIGVFTPNPSPAHGIPVTTVQKPTQPQVAPALVPFPGVAMNQIPHPTPQPVPQQVPQPVPQQQQPQQQPQQQQPPRPKRAPAAQQQQPINPAAIVEIERLVSNGKFDDAFKAALSAKDVGLTTFVCTHSGQPQDVTPHLSQPVLLSLLQQLSNGIGQAPDIALRLGWLIASIPHTNPSEPRVGPLVPKILSSVSSVVGSLLTAQGPIGQAAKTIQQLIAQKIAPPSAE